MSNIFTNEKIENQNFTNNIIENNGEKNSLTNVRVAKPLIVGTYAFLLSQQEKRKYGNMTHKWTCLLRCPNNSDISLFINKVIFELDPSFVFPRRVYNQPPYEVSEIGWGEFYLKVKIYFADNSLPCVNIVHFVKLNTDSQVESENPVCVVNETYEEIIFKNPSLQLYNKIVESNHTKLPNHKFQEYFWKYNFIEEEYTQKYLTLQNEIHLEINDLLKTANELATEINKNQNIFLLNNRM